MLKSFFLKIISSVITSLIIMVIMAVFSLSLLTKKFPPDMKTVKEYASYLTNAKENYSQLLALSQNQMKLQSIDTNDLAEKNALAAGSNEHIKNEPVDRENYPNSNTNQATLKIYRPDDDQMKQDIELIKARLDGLEKQQKLILEKLNK